MTPMHPIRTPRVKICCIRSHDEALLAIRHGASAALGLVSAMPSGPGPIPEELIAEIAAQVPPLIATFLLTSRRDAASIIEQQRYTRVNTLQIVDHLATSELIELHRALPGVRLVQVIHVEGPESLEEVKPSRRTWMQFCSTREDPKRPLRNLAERDEYMTGP